MKKPLFALAAAALAAVPFVTTQGYALEASTFGSVAGSAAATAWDASNGDRHRHKEMVFVAVADDAAAVLAGQGVSAELYSAMELAREDITAVEGADKASQKTVFELAEYILDRVSEHAAGN